MKFRRQIKAIFFDEETRFILNRNFIIFLRIIFLSSLNLFFKILFLNHTFAKSWIRNEIFVSVGNKNETSLHCMRAVILSHLPIFFHTQLTRLITMTQTLQIDDINNYSSHHAPQSLRIKKARSRTL